MDVAAGRKFFISAIQKTRFSSGSVIFSWPYFCYNPWEMVVEDFESHWFQRMVMKLSLMHGQTRGISQVVRLHFDNHLDA